MALIIELLYYYHYLNTTKTRKSYRKKYDIADMNPTALRVRYDVSLVLFFGSDTPTATRRLYSHQHSHTVMNSLSICFTSFCMLHLSLSFCMLHLSLFLSASPLSLSFRLLHLSLSFRLLHLSHSLKVCSFSTPFTFSQCISLL